MTTDPYLSPQCVSGDCVACEPSVRYILVSDEPADPPCTHECHGGPNPLPDIDAPFAAHTSATPTPQISSHPRGVSGQSSNVRAGLLRSYHYDPAGVLVLPNAWDAGSAAVFAAAGARAIATTSGGIAWSLGRPDGQQLGRAEMVDAVARIAAAVDIPVTADVEAGYGLEPADVAAMVEAVVDTGAVGVNLEDSGAPGGGMFAVDVQARRLRAARDAARASGVPDLVVNARTDVYLLQVGSVAGRLDEVRARAEAYAAAGADCLFVPGLLDLTVLAWLVAVSPLPVNAMAAPGGPSIAELSAVGVQRVSVGTGIAQAAYTVAGRAAAELLTSGTYKALAGGFEFTDLNHLFKA